MNTKPGFKEPHTDQLYSSCKNSGFRYNPHFITCISTRVWRRLLLHIKSCFCKIVIKY
jgi:hypothetical protein